MYVARMQFLVVELGWLRLLSLPSLLPWRSPVSGESLHYNLGWMGPGACFRAIGQICYTRTAVSTPFQK